MNFNYAKFSMEFRGYKIKVNVPNLGSNFLNLVLYCASIYFSSTCKYCYKEFQVHFIYVIQIYTYVKNLNPIVTNINTYIAKINTHVANQNTSVTKRNIYTKDFKYDVTVWGIDMINCNSLAISQDYEVEIKKNTIRGKNVCHRSKF